MPYAKQLVVVVAAVLIPIAAPSTDLDTETAAPFTLSGAPAAPLARPAHRFTLREPGDVLLPPIEALDAAGSLAHSPRDPGRRFDIDAPAQAESPDDRDTPGGPLSYSLSPALTAELDYRHSLLFDTAPAEALRTNPFSGFSTERERDVLGLKMSWRLAGSTVGLDYQLHAARADSVTGEQGLAAVIPGQEQTLHALTLGVRREWGAPRPPLVAADVPHLDVGPGAVEASEPTPTP